MGTFDTLIDKSGHEEQSKAFGQGMQVFRVGDAVRLARAPFSQAEYDAWLAGEWDGDPGTDATSYEVQCSGSTVACIRRGIFVGFSTKRDTDLPVFDYHGRDITALMVGLDDPGFVSGREQTVALAWVHGLVVRAAYYDRNHDRMVGREQVNEAIACLLSYCNTYQCDVPAGVPEPRAYRLFLAGRAASVRARSSVPTGRRAAVSLIAAGNGSALVGASADVTSVPSSLFVLNESFQVVQPHPTTVGALADDPTMRPQEIADVFVATLGAIRELPDVGFLMRPTPRALGQAGPVAVDPGWSGEERFTLCVQALRKAGLVAVGPDWSGRSRLDR